MINKFKALLGSSRFWLLTLGLAVALLQAGVDGGLTLAFLFQAVEVWLGAVVGLGTLDSIATKFRGK